LSSLKKIFFYFFAGIFHTDSAATADKLVRSFSYVIDSRFEYIFPFKPRAWDCLNPEMLNYFDLTEEYLPFVRCFENQGGKTK